MRNFVEMDMSEVPRSVRSVVNKKGWRTNGTRLGVKAERTGMLLEECCRGQNREICGCALSGVDMPCATALPLVCS